MGPCTVHPPSCLAPDHPRFCDAVLTAHLLDLHSSGIGSKEFPRFVQPQGDFGTEIWTNFSPTSPGILQVLYRFPVPELTAVFILDSLPKMSTVLRKAVFPSPSGPGTLHWKHGIGVRGAAYFNTGPCVNLSRPPWDSLEMAPGYLSFCTCASAGH